MNVIRIYFDFTIIFENFVQFIAQSLGRITDVVQCTSVRRIASRGLFLLAVCALAARGDPVTLPPLPASPYADTEVSTNVPFNAVRSDAREFGVSMAFTGTASNGVQVAFGRDADGDGDLAPEETRLLLGWRAGAYFIEDAAAGARTSEPATAGGDARHLDLQVTLDRAFRPRAAAAANETGACFVQTLAKPPEWLYDADWNLMKVTRRGVDAIGEAIAVDCRYRFFRISIR